MPGGYEYFQSLPESERRRAYDAIAEELSDMTMKERVFSALETMGPEEVDGYAHNRFHLALKSAIVLMQNQDNGYDVEIEALSAILEQRGCEELDPAVTDGRLTSFISVVIDG